MLYSIALALFVAACGTAASTSEAEYQTAFTNWMQKHNKNYKSDEFFAKYSVFKSTYDKVNKHNADPTATYKMETNFMADLTEKEYRQLYLGRKKSSGSKHIATPSIHTIEGDAPSSVDWSKKGAVTPVKDQGQCGSCWTFSTTGAVEGAHFLKTGKLVSASEQQIVDCTKGHPYKQDACGGGDEAVAMKYVIANNGLDSEKSYPYTSGDGTAKGKCKFNADNVVATISYVNSTKSGDETQLLNAVIGRPISIAIDASHASFQAYSSGIYYEPKCSTTELDHAVLLVGYGSNDKGDYWIVKNSWGSDWGQSGYLWMARNKKNACGIATEAIYPTA